MSCALDSLEILYHDFPPVHINLYLLVSLKTCMILIMQEQVTSTIRFSQGTRSANVMSICFETARQLGGIHYLWPGVGVISCIY